MKICDRCGHNPIAIVLLDKRDGQEWDLCGECKEAFLRFLAKLESQTLVTSDGNIIGGVPEDLPISQPIKKKPGRPKKNGSE